jgi:hypothetical protein
MPTSIQSLDDWHLLCPLFIAVAISPICLLSGKNYASSSQERFGMGSGVKVRTMLYESGPWAYKLAIQTLSQPRLEDNPIRDKIEHTMLNMIFNAALRGAGSLRRDMKNVLLENRAAVAQLPPPQLKPWFEDYRMRIELQDPSYKRALLLSSVKKETKKLEKHILVIDLEAEDWYLQASPDPKVTRRLKAEASPPLQESVGGKGLSSASTLPIGLGESYFILA